MDNNLLCRCGRPYCNENHLSPLCPICIAETLVGINITEISKSEYDLALKIFKEFPRIAHNLNQIPDKSI